MMKTIVQQLADFTAHSSYAQLPAEVVEESKRILLDSIGCALTAANGRMMGCSPEITAHALGIAGCTSPVNAHWAWVQHAPSTTLKYLMAGSLTQTAMTAAHMAKMGHRGDL